MWILQFNRKEDKSGLTLQRVPLHILSPENLRVRSEDCARAMTCHNYGREQTVERWIYTLPRRMIRSREALERQIRTYESALPAMKVELPRFRHVHI